MLYFINRPNFITLFLLFLEILDSICVAVVSFPGCDAIFLKISINFLVAFIYDRKIKTEIEYLENKKGFEGEIKSIFYHFKGFFEIVSDLRVRL